MKKPNIIAYLKPTCGWSQGVRAVLRKYDLPFEDRNIKDRIALRPEGKLAQSERHRIAYRGCSFRARYRDHCDR